jgi:hypothetical protein
MKVIEPVDHYAGTDDHRAQDARIVQALQRS